VTCRTSAADIANDA